MTSNGDDFVSGAQVRGEGPHWRLYEIAGATHLPMFHFDEKAVGFRAATMADQNNLDVRPVYRAMLDNLRRWIVTGTPPPANALLEGQIRYDITTELGRVPWFVPSAFIPPGFDRSSSYDLNAEGGVRLPQVRTEDFGSPLGLYRGVECDTPQPLTDALSCPLYVRMVRDDPGLFDILAAGSFVPYSSLTTELSANNLANPCARYTSRGAYLDMARTAALHAAGQRWILVDDIPQVVAAAERLANDYPGCVPSG